MQNIESKKIKFMFVVSILIKSKFIRNTKAITKLKKIKA